MKLKITKTLSNSVFTSKFELTEISTFDQDLLDDYAGSLEFNVSGDVTKVVQVDDGLGGTKPETVVLLKQGNKFVPFAAGLPLEKAWSILQYGDKTQEIAEEATSILEKRIVDLVAELRLKSDTFSSVTEIPL